MLIGASIARPPVAFPCPVPLPATDVATPVFASTRRMRPELDPRDIQVTRGVAQHIANREVDRRARRLDRRGYSRFFLRDLGLGTAVVPLTTAIRRHTATFGPTVRGFGSDCTIATYIGATSKLMSSTFPIVLPASSATRTEARPVLSTAIISVTICSRRGSGRASWLAEL